MKDFEQSVVAITSEISTCLRSISPTQVQGALQAIDGARRLYVAGVGRSGFAMRAFAMRLMHLGRRVHFVGDVTTPGIGEGDLLIIGSGSGSTESLQVIARKAKSLGAEVVLITIDTISPIAAVAGHLIRIPAPSPKAADTNGRVDSAQPMGSLFEQCLLLLNDIIILLLMDRQHIGPEEMFARHANLEWRHPVQPGKRQEDKIQLWALVYWRTDQVGRQLFLNLFALWFNSNDLSWV